MSAERPVPALPRADVVVDAAGFLCPMPIVRLAEAVRSVEVVATDPGILADAPAWAQMTRQEIIGAWSDGDRHHFWFRKIHA